MATRLRVAVVGQYSPPELIKVSLGGLKLNEGVTHTCVKSVSQVGVSARGDRWLWRGWQRAKISRTCGPPIEIAALRTARLISYIE